MRAIQPGADPSRLRVTRRWRHAPIRAGADSDFAPHADGLSFEQAALTEPCCVAYNAVVHNARIRPGDRVVVLGPGPIGFLCGAIARFCGAEVAVVGLENDRARLDVAKQYGCDVIVGDATDWAREVDGLGADGVVDATGVSVALSARTRPWCGPPAGSAKSVGDRSRSVSRSIGSCKRTSRCKAASVTIGRSGSASFA